MKENLAESEFSQTWFENGIIHQVIKPHLKKFDMVVAKALIADRIKACQPVKGVSFPVILEMKNMVTIDKETREFYSLKEPFNHLSKIAIVTDNYVGRLLGNLVYRINVPPIPMVFFNDKKKALEWLQKNN
jgi:hypothetical protein